MSEGSSFGQDRWIIDDVLGTSVAKGYKGFFIEAGAAKGVDGSNTLILERQYGWSGLLVEPNKYFFDVLARLRKAHCENVVLSDKDGEIEFIQSGYFGTATDHVRNHFEARGLDIYKHGRYQENADGSPAERSMLPAVTLRTLLKRIQAPQIIDYFSLDVEGGELAVLKGFPFDTHVIRALTVESCFRYEGRLYDTHQRKECRALLEGKGYRFVQTLEYDDCYVWPEKLPAPQQGGSALSALVGRLAAMLMQYRGQRAPS